MIEDIYYSRKNFKRPLLQRSQHKSFEKEVNTLDRLFRDGAAYCMGTMNKDCWYMYTLNPMERYRPENHRELHQGLLECSLKICDWKGVS